MFIALYYASYGFKYFKWIPSFNLCDKLNYILSLFHFTGEKTELQKG